MRLGTIVTAALLTLAAGCSGGAGSQTSSSAATAAPELAKLDVTLKDLDGKDVNLASFKGRPLLINFWATYCGPCKEEIPMLIQLADQYKDQGLTVLGISSDDTAKQMKPFVAEYKMTYPVLVGVDNDAFLEAYDAQVSIPRTWLIRRDGTVAAKSIGPNTREWFETRLRELVKSE
jgi:thiol-disulfide isomerase/thioredoxin